MKKNTQNGITLIALVITIIVLLILAGVSLSLIIGDSGVVKKASDAKVKTIHATVKEAIALQESSYQVDKVEKQSKESFIEYLKKELIIQDNEEGTYNVIVKNLVGEKQSLGNGTGSKDIYKLEKMEDTENYVVNYYDQEGTKTEIIQIIVGQTNDDKKKPEQMEPTEIYAKVYEDGTAIFSSYGYEEDGHGELEYTFTTEDLNYNLGEQPPKWLIIGGTNGIAGSNFRNVIIVDKIAPTSTSYWFCKTSSITGIENLVTNNVTDMSMMFSDCEMKNLDLSNFDTSSVTTMRHMFSVGSDDFSVDDGTFENLDLSSFDTKKVTDMSGMFMWQEILETLDMSNFDVNETTNLSSMFSKCNKLKTVYVKSEEIGELLKPYAPETTTFVVK